MNDVINIVSNVGFPIFACVYVVKVMGKQISDLTEVVNNNTHMIEKLINSVNRIRKE